MNKKQKNNKIEILVIFNSLMRVIGGGSRHIIEIVDYWCDENKIDYLLSNAGWKVAKPHIEKKKSPNKNIMLYSTLFDDSNNFILVYISRIFSSLRMRFKIKKKYDIIIAPNYLPQNMIPVIFFKKKNSKSVVYFHTTPPHIRKEYLNKVKVMRKYLSLVNWIFCVFLAKNFFDIIFVVNNVTREYFIGKGIPQNKIFIAYNGVDLDTIRNIKVNKNEFDACFLGRLVKNKGIFDLIQIWKAIVKKKPMAKLCIIGDGPEKTKLEDKINKENLNSNIYLAGQLEGNNKYKIMKQSHYFLYPSYYEAQPVVLFEAFACNLTVLAYNLPVYNEFFKGNIFLADLYNTDQLVSQLLTLIDNCENDNSNDETSTELIYIKNWKEIAEEQMSILYSILGDDKI